MHIARLWHILRGGGGSGGEAHRAGTLRRAQMKARVHQMERTTRDEATHYNSFMNRVTIRTTTTMFARINTREY